MRSPLRLPTKTRYGWIILLLLTCLFATIEDEAFSFSGVLGRLSGIFAMLTGILSIIEITAFAGAGHVPEDVKAEDDSAAATAKGTNVAKVPWPWLAQACLLVVLGALVLFLVGSAI